jgi:hypothetical protein
MRFSIFLFLCVVYMRNHEGAHAEFVLSYTHISDIFLISLINVRVQLVCIT